MNNALLVGCGSVGLKHLEVLETFTKSIDVIDIKDISNFIKDKSNINQYNSIDDIDAQKKYDIVIIATWANSHHELIKKCIRFQPTGIVIEKPLSNSIRTCQEIVEIAKKMELIFYVTLPEALAP